ncbi:hypothetical protein POM88_005075 [Heracleum sosnowskyi]|uniref:Uncharacterized protein n=1 Tax=Heracleum sosnowskyi TaxID=360622 RepID=A0AAD8JJ87_9APIA|nr:hypothetical protein POM88_005075 [Heracleum sosnowskyi]
MESDMSLKSCSTRKRKNIESDDEKGKRKIKIQTETLKQEDESGEAIRSDMSLKSCSTRKRKNNDETLKQEDESGEAVRSDMSLKSCSTRKTKNIESDDEKGKNKKKKKIKIPTIRSDMSLRRNRKKKGYSVNLSELRFGRLLTRKKNKTQSYVNDSCPKWWNEVVKQHPQAVNKGDIINLSELLFTKGRDFLITYNDRNHPVQARHLEGMVLRCNANDIFHMFGACAYPFTDERMECLLREVAEARKHPSITKLLASSERNHLINNDNQAVPLRNLEDKTTFLQKDGSMVQLSQLEGKRIIIIVEDDQHIPDAKFWRMLRARYLQVKGTVASILPHALELSFTLEMQFKQEFLGMSHGQSKDSNALSSSAATTLSSSSLVTSSCSMFHQLHRKSCLCSGTRGTMP